MEQIKNERAGAALIDGPQHYYNGEQEEQKEVSTNLKKMYW